MVSISPEQVEELMKRNEELMALVQTLVKGKEAAGASAEGLASKPKLRSFRGVKFAGREREFETFLMTYDATRALDAGDFVGWTEKDMVAYLVSAVEGKALEVVRASILAHRARLTYKEVIDDLVAAYRDPAEGERALTKL